MVEQRNLRSDVLIACHGVTAGFFKVWYGPAFAFMRPFAGRAILSAMSIELTPAEEELIRRQREQRAVNTAGGYGPVPKPGKPETQFLAISTRSTRPGYAPLIRESLDEATIADIKRVKWPLSLGPAEPLS
jgi:hypothetical protein